MAVKVSLGAKFFLACSISGACFSTFADDSSAQQKVPMEHLQNFTDTINYIKYNYVSDVKDEQLFDNAIRGMLTSLDPHSNFLDEEEFKEMMVSTNGEFGGLGIEVTLDHGLIKVISPIDDTPAYKAGIKPGDFIVKIENKPVHGIGLKKSVELMRGKPGTKVALLVLRKGETKPLTFNIAREIIKVASVKHKVLLEEYGYIKISQFQQQTGESLASAIAEIKKSTNNKAKGLVLDLRNNPGGTLGSAIVVADHFLDKNKYKNHTIVSTKGKSKLSEANETMKSGDSTNGLPLVVLVNEGSASASEIVAGALQDHKRALIVGTQTFGKGSVQTLIPLQKNRGIKLTTALYYTPNGRSIQAKGIEPDIYVKQIEVKQEVEDKSAELSAIKENQLEKFIQNAQETTDNTTKNTLAQKDELLNDYQLYEAINILKTMQLSLR